MTDDYDDQLAIAEASLSDKDATLNEDLSLTDEQKTDYALLKNRENAYSNPVMTNLAHDEEYIKFMENMSGAPGRYTFSRPKFDNAGEYSRNRVCCGPQQKLSSRPEITNKNETNRGVDTNSRSLSGQFSGYHSTFNKSGSYVNHPANAERIDSGSLRTVRHESDISGMDVSNRTFSISHPTSQQINNNVGSVNIDVESAGRSYMIPSSANVDVLFSNTNVSTRQSNYS